MIAPFLIVPVAAALLFKHGIYNPVYGLLNGTLTGIWHTFGSNNPPQPDWLTVHPTMAVEAELIWQWTPFMMLILLAGLQSRDGEVMEAAYVDGSIALAGLPVHHVAAHAPLHRAGRVARQHLHRV